MALIIGDTMPYRFSPYSMNLYSTSIAKTSQRIEAGNYAPPAKDTLSMQIIKFDAVQRHKQEGDVAASDFKDHCSIQEMTENLLYYVIW